MVRSMTSTPASGHCEPVVLLDTVGGDHAMFLAMTDIFFRECNAKFTSLRQAVAAGDVRATGRQAHGLKGTVGPVAATALLRMLQQLEDDCERKGVGCDAARLAAIHAEMAAVAAEVRQFMAAL
jgi:HPt (histidine-containing phosphotransfer) domain-containing protein